MESDVGQRDMKQPITKPVQKWAASMVLISFQLLALLVVGVLLFALLPSSSYGTILIMLSALAIVLSLLAGHVISWLAED